VRIGFITSRDLPDLYEDDRLAADELRRRGHEVSPLIWTEARPEDLHAFDALVMRSPWDWFQHRARFRAFLDALFRARTHVVNRPALLLEFADKTYLSRLAARGFDVVPTVQLTREALTTVPTILAERGWDRAVLKPAFTANAVGAHRFDAADAASIVAAARGADDTEPWLLQPFIPAIADGELSFIFFGDRFSHAVKKRPRAGEWRVQHEYGGDALPVEATQRESNQAAALLAGAASGGTVYARVDVVPWGGRLHLMELELVEPELFFRHEASAAERFADALLACLED
jgi:glutathione synthase/RimK-type ligase-like ATP-grasp enzyme